jgi:CheY-like chemotaxis protein
MRILICDDEPLIAATLSEHLELCGHRTSVFHSARELLIAFEADRADVGLVITDLCMPDRDGLRLAETVRRMDQRVPVALMTSHALPWNDEDLRRRGVSCLLRKPLHMHLVEAVAASALDIATKGNP